MAGFLFDRCEKKIRTFGGIKPPEKQAKAWSVRVFIKFREKKTTRESKKNLTANVSSSKMFNRVLSFVEGTVSPFFHRDFFADSSQFPQKKKKKKSEKSCNPRFPPPLHFSINCSSTFGLPSLPFSAPYLRREILSDPKNGVGEKAVCAHTHQFGEYKEARKEVR